MRPGPVWPGPSDLVQRREEGRPWRTGEQLSDVTSAGPQRGSRREGPRRRPGLPGNGGVSPGRPGAAGAAADRLPPSHVRFGSRTVTRSPESRRCSPHATTQVRATGRRLSPGRSQSPLRWPRLPCSRGLSPAQQPEALRAPPHLRAPTTASARLRALVHRVVRGHSPVFMKDRGGVAYSRPHTGRPREPGGRCWWPQASRSPPRPALQLGVAVWPTRKRESAGFLAGGAGGSCVSDPDAARSPSSFLLPVV